VHYFWYVGIMVTTMDLPTALAFIFVSQTFSGLLIALAFGVGHNGMAIYDADKKPGFAELQITTTRNVDNDAFGLVGWFMGGLHLQVEHHLFPGIPRHNLAQVRPMIEALCAKHGVPYRSTGLYEGNVEVVSHLRDVRRMLDEFPAM